MRTKRIMINYKVAYTNSRSSSPHRLYNREFGLPNVRALALRLNTFVRDNPNFKVVACYIVDNDGYYLDAVKFLDIEYECQQWITGWRSRLLANAQERGYDIKWNHGLKKSGARR